jgi:PAS domain S-box-containing protein
VRQVFIYTPVLPLQRGYHWLALVVVFLIVARATFGQEPPHAKNVLVIDGFNDRVSDSVALLKPPVIGRFAGPVNFYHEYAETWAFTTPNYEESLVETLRQKYRGQVLDLVIPISYPALQFVLKYRDSLFPGVPIVFTSVEARRLAGQQILPGMTGVTININLRATIELALRLHPDANTVAVIAGDTDFEKYWLAAIQDEISRFRDKVGEIDLVGLPVDELLERVAALPPRTVVLFFEVQRESNQPVMGIYDVLAWVGQRFPTYCPEAEQCLKYGGIGGANNDQKQEVSLTADVAARVLSGERPDDIPVVNATGWLYRVDWRQLRRWNIAESKLPLGTMVLYREPTLWERGRKYFLAGIAVIFTQALLIFALFWQRALKRKTEGELRRSEEKFAKSFRQSPLAVSITNTKDGRYIDVNEAFEQQTGWRRDEVIGRTALDIDHWVNRTQRDAFLKELLAMGNVRDLEVTLQRKDGEIRETRGSAELIEVHGEPCILSVFADITERKQAEQVLTSLSGRLIEAQEAERKRIARELHDDISQKLALLSMEVAKTNHGVNGSDRTTKERLEEIREHCSAIAHDVQSLSHELHYSKLEYLGLVAALRSFCKEFAKQSGVEIEFTDENVPRQLPNNIALSLFRVAQEALHNAVKYSGVRRFIVRLTALPNEIELVVKDSGAGFDVEEAKQNQGLGLLSMQERVHLVHGRFQIESRPGEGAAIIASVPLPSENSTAPTDAQSNHAPSVPRVA